MSEIELVIKIPEETYEYWKEHKYEYILSEAIANGVPLPKGHGRIGDLDALERNMIGGIKSANFEEGYADYAHINNVDDCVDCVRYADTIIETDKEE